MKKKRRNSLSTSSSLSLFLVLLLNQKTPKQNGMFYSSARTAFTGFLLTAAAGLALVYHFGVRPWASEHE